MDNNLIDNYIKYVSEKLETMQEYTSSLRKPDISISELKEMTGERLHVNYVLTGEYQRLKTRCEQAEEGFKVWWSDKFSAVRSDLNPKSISGNKFSSKTEIDAETIARNKEEYLERKERLLLLQSQTEFVKKLIEDWRSVQTDITNSIRLLELESKEAGFNNYLNNRQKQNNVQNIPRTR
jgi:hypothetical protein